MDELTLVSVDLDDLGCYHAIHGLPEPSDSTRGVVLRRCLPRFLEVFAELDVKATFFVIGRDLEADDGDGAALLERAMDEGHELGNHSYAHAYDMVRWSADAIRADVRTCDAQLRALGADPVGFRAPGYTHNDAMLEQVAACGYAYDSSALPSPPYYLAKLAAIGLHAVRGRRSQSLASGAGSFLGPRAPYRHTSGLHEFPISVTPALRVPLIGTSLLSGPARLAARLRRTAARLPYLHLELHGLDLADPDTDGYDPHLLAVQPELRRSLAQKREALAELLTARGETTLLRDAEP